MNNSKLINVLRTFSKSEFKEFEKIAASPYFNRGRNFMPFVKELKKFHPKFDNDKMTAEYIFGRMHPGKKVNKQMIWNLSSGLYSLAEEFLVQVSLKKNRFNKNSHIQDELYYRKLVKQGSQKLAEMEKDLKSMDIGSNYFQHKIAVEIAKTNLLFMEDKQHLVPGYILKEGEYSILYFITLLSNVINNLHYNMLLFNTKIDTNLPYVLFNNMDIQKVVAYAKEEKHKYAFVLEMYYSFIMTAVKPEENSYFYKAKELFEKHSMDFEGAERDICLGILCNYCIYKVNNGEEYFNRMLFEVNLIQLKAVDEMRKKDFGKILYIQVLRNALLIGEVEWAKKYIEKYTPYLKTSYQKPMRKLADAFIAFKTKDFNSVIENLSNARFFDTRDKFYVKSLSLCAYYELNEILPLMYNIDTSKQFVIKNPSLGKLTRNNFNLFLVALKKLTEIKEKMNLTSLETLKEEVSLERGMINHGWLLEKIEEIKKGAE